MATVVGQASAAATSVAIPAHAVGDLIIVSARGTAAAPSIPAAGGTVPAWVSIQTGLANSIGLTVGAFVATATTTTTGAWTNATHICVLVLRPASGKYLSTSAARSSVGNGNNTQTIIYPALTLALTDGSSLGVRVGTRVTAITAVGTPPTSWTNQSIQPAGASALMAVHTRAALTANPTADTVTVTSSNAAYRAVTLEVQELNLGQSVTVAGPGSAQAFGSRTITGRVVVGVAGVFPSGYTSPILNKFLVGQKNVGGWALAQFGTVTASLVQLAPAGGVLSAQAFGVPTVKTSVVKPSGGVPSAQAFGAITIRANITIAVGGVGSAQAFGHFGQTVLVLGVRPPAVYSITGGVITGDGHVCYGVGTQFGFPTFSYSVRVTGLGSAQAFGSVFAKSSISRPAGGVVSAQAFGVPTSKTVASFTVAGCASAQAFGVPVFILAAGPQTVGVPGVTPTGIVLSITGLVLTGDGHVCFGLGGQFGHPTFSTRVTRAIGGLGSAQAFGSPIGRNVIVLGGLGSAQAFGAPTIKTWIGVPVFAIPSAQAFGLVRAVHLWLHQIACLEDDLASAGETDLALMAAVCVGSGEASITGGPICGDGHVCGGGVDLLHPVTPLDDPLVPATARSIDLQPAGCA